MATARAFDAVKPTIELRQDSAQGTSIPSGGAAGGAIYVKAIDPASNQAGGDPNYPTPSGIYKWTEPRHRAATVPAPRSPL